MKNSNKPDELIVVGWREWIQIPELGIPYIKVKVDTGAKTSALHAKKIQTFKERGALWVSFEMMPLQGRSDVRVSCMSEVIDHRVVSDSGGHREKRYVIESNLIVGTHVFSCEITLTDRESMRFRMLLGREAMENRILVDPSKSYLMGHPTVSSKMFPKGTRHDGLKGKKS